jgi:glycosyltransferase involved in cell wall biosynthesis
MKIGIDIRHLCSINQSGVGYYTINLIKALANIAQDDEFILFATGSKRRCSLLPSFPEKNVRIVARHIPNKLITLALKAPGKKTLESFLNEDIDYWLFPNINTIKTNLPYAITLHDMSFQLFPHFFTFKQRLWHKNANVQKLINKASVVFTVSNKTKKDALRYTKIHSNRIQVTPLGVNSSFTAKTQPSDKNYLRHYNINFPYLLTLSTLEPRKNIESVIEAFDRIQDQKTHLIIAGGSGWKTTTISQALIKTRHRNRIHLIGYVSNKHKAALMRNAAAFIFPSYYEGFGLPILESMACGTPVITSFTSSMPEVAGNAGILIDPFNTQDIQQAINSITQDPKLSSLLSQRGIERASDFTWSATAQKTLKRIKNMS